VNDVRIFVQFLRRFSQGAEFLDGPVLHGDLCKGASNGGRCREGCEAKAGLPASRRPAWRARMPMTVTCRSCSEESVS
jgi:hypothetical protein